MKCPVCNREKSERWCRKCWLTFHRWDGLVVVGWIDLDYQNNPRVLEKLLLLECRRMYKASDWQRWSHLMQVELDEIKDPEWQFQFSMLADWLADNDCPLQEATVRQLLEK